MKPKTSLRHFLALAGGFILAISSASADTLYYDGGTVDIAGNGDSAASGLTGDWSTSLENWDAGPVPYVGWNNSNNDIAFFHRGTAIPGPNPGTVSLTSGITVGGIIFNASGYNISTGAHALTFGGINNTIALNNKVTAATITGTLGTSSSNMIFTAQNPLTNHTLTFTGANATGWSGTTTVNAGMTLAVAGGSQNGALSNTSAITLNGGNISVSSITTANIGYNYFNDSAAITVNGGGSLTWRGINTGAGSETIGAVTVNSGQMSFFGGSQSSGTNTLIVPSINRTSATSTLIFSQGNNAVLVDGSPNRIQVTGSGTTAGWVSGASSNPIIGAWATTGTGSGAEYAVYSNNNVVASNTVGSAENTWTSATDAYTLNTGSAVALTGNRTINGLRFIGSASDLSLGDFNLETTGILWGGANASKNILGGGTGVLTTHSGGGSLFLTAAASIAHTVSAPIANNSGNVTVVKSGAGSLTLSGNNTYSGGTVVNAGTLIVNGTNTFATGAGGADVINGGALTYSTITSWGGTGRDVTFNGTGTLTSTAGGYTGGTLTANAGANANIAAGGGSLAFATTTGAGNVIFSSGANRLLNLGNASGLTGNLQARLTNNANYGSGIAIQFSGLGDAVGSAIQFVGGQGDGNQPMTVAYNGSSALVFNNRQIEIQDRLTSNWEIRYNTLANNSSDAAHTWTINTDLLYTGGSAITAFGGSLQANRTLRLSGTNTGDNAFNGVINNGQNTNGLHVDKDGSGKWILGGANTYTGNTSVTAGTLEIGGSGTLGNISAGVGDYASNISISSTNSGRLVYNSSANQTLSGVISGAGALVKNNTGRLTLTNSNSYTGNTTVDGGTLEISGSGDINQSTAISVNAGGRLIYNSSTALTTSPTLNGTGTGAGQRAVLGGEGPINVAVTLDNVGDVLSPGNSPGTQAYTVGQSWASFSYDWELNNFTGTSAGTDFDQINITGALTLTGAASGSYILNILSLTALNEAGTVPNFSEIDRSWAILTTTAGITGFDASYWTLNTAGFTNSYDGTWSLGLANNDNDLLLTYTAIPEPRAALLGGLGLLMLLRRRR